MNWQTCVNFVNMKIPQVSSAVLGLICEKRATKIQVVAVKLRAQICDLLSRMRQDEWN